MEDRVYRNPSKQSDVDDPQWDKIGLFIPHDWRNYVGKRTRKIWHTFTPGQRLILAADADDMAGEEEWD